MNDFHYSLKNVKEVERRVSTIQRFEVVKEKGFGVRYQWRKGERCYLHLVLQK